MFKINLTLTLCFLFLSRVEAQTVLSANGEGDTYELINSVLAPNYDVVEVPDCNHDNFGRHIDETFDSELNKNVFRFYIHTNEDDDRCINFDRQRNEIKTYDKSPNNLLGVENEKVIYKWKMKLDVNFQPSSSFTHLHQLKSVGGDYSSIPMYTLTARKGTPDQLELRYTNTDDQSTIKKVDLSLLKGNWVEITEKIAYGSNTEYSIEIVKISTGETLFDYSDTSTENWQSGAEFVRPKWGIYRSLNDINSLRDETVLFADFSIEEVSTLSTESFIINNLRVKIYPNPTTESIFIEEKTANSYDSILIYDTLGRLIQRNNKAADNTISVSNLNTGTYYFVFKKENEIISKNSVLID
ncbi:T9SS type A sorting domain-containing protein [uncultured Polaribacter sp.]|uniref:T9SS type A sorting domain-containing protein n=1 Tax=uncultured Polaribacter sp. TaxID=174711 RepID=UPI002617D9C0|nr:T9SS type A sorting domain-containing protein [uncultured Polaribacter sp.]